MALEVNSRLGILNGEIDAAWFFFAKTFEASPDNIAIAKTNANSSYQFIGGLCKHTADLVGQLISAAETA